MYLGDLIDNPNFRNCVNFYMKKPSVVLKLIKGIPIYFMKIFLKFLRSRVITGNSIDRGFRAKNQISVLVGFRPVRKKSDQETSIN